MAEYPELTEETTEKQEEVTVASSPFDLNIDDNELVAIINRKFDESESFYREQLKLESRRAENKNFWLGKQLDEGKLYEWQIPYKDNLIWQDLETRIAIAASRMPDIIVTPTGKEEEKIDAAKNLEKALDIKIRSDSTKRLIKHGLRDNHLDFIGIVKVRWDKNKGENGDFIFERVRPDRVTLDHTGTIPEDGFSADNMDFVGEWIDEPVAVVLSKFANKKDELFRELGIVKGTTRQLATKMKYREIWFTWYEKDGKIVEGVCWKYKNLILGKMKHPYWDWEGYEKILEQATIDESGMPVVTETLYHNHLDRPRKPYIFFSHQNLGRSPIDDTSPVEQAIPIQKYINKRGRQITEISDRAVPKIGFAGKYIDKNDAARITNDPDEHIWLQGADDINKAITFIPAQAPSPVLYNDLVSNRQQIDSKFATHSTTRGEKVAQESGISKQITREGDLMVSDDVVNIVVERVVYEMANWAVQMMKVMYDKPHFVRDTGKDGELLALELQRDSIEDGILVNVKASSVDKQQKRVDALNLAAQKAIDPLSLMEDLDLPNPKERAKRLLAFLSGDFVLYAQTIGVDLGLQQPAAGNPEANPEQDQQQAVLDIQRLQAGEDFEPNPPTEGYMQTMMQFVQSPDFAAQPDDVKQRFVGFVGKLRGALAQGAPEQPV